MSITIATRLYKRAQGGSLMQPPPHSTSTSILKCVCRSGSGRVREFRPVESLTPARPHVPEDAAHPPSLSSPSSPRHTPLWVRFCHNSCSVERACPSCDPVGSVWMLLLPPTVHRQVLGRSSFNTPRPPPPVPQADNLLGFLILTFLLSPVFSQCEPPIEVEDLFQDIQDGYVLLALLEELSGCKLVCLSSFLLSPEGHARASTPACPPVTFVSL